ncbi:MAG: VCBS repeat-containing protein, partial [Candidatus Eisenbacteria bacterium]|nr:VCBS repeat-containing protein [Candidatus Eisenbacteria bacterium]
MPRRSAWLCPVRRSLLPALILAMLFAGPAAATFSLSSTPDWESNPNNLYGTGFAVGDLDRDGWVDLVVANGNDMARQNVAVYRNQGDGTYAAAPTWTSQDVDYHGHLDLADVDGDGALDCAVAVYLGSGGFSQPGRVKLYKGNGDGTFSATPVWQSAESFYCFSCAFGDVDNDGRPDLACATGEDYNGNPERRRLFRNVGGALETMPSWMSSEIEYSLDVTWADFNNDGWLDLAFAGSSGPNRVYFNEEGTLEPSAGWSSGDASLYANTAAAGDYDADGWVDLAIADNNQLGGSGHFKVYRNAGGTLGATPIWQSAQTGYGSHVSWIDLDEDGDLDLATGMWWGPVRIYENLGGALATSPAFTTATSSVIENEVWEDVDNDGLQAALDATWTASGSRKLFTLPQRPVREIVSLTVDGVPVDPDQIELDADDAWIVLPSAPPVGASVRAIYVSSADIDLALSNWDPSEGEYLFLNHRDPSLVAELAPIGTIRLLVSPNPSSGAATILLEGVGAA